MLDKNTPHTFFYLKFIPKFLCCLFFSFSFLSASSAEDLLFQMTLRDKIAQLFMVPVQTDSKDSNVSQTLHLLEKTPIGGVIFFLGTIQEQKKAVELLQAKSKFPLLIGQDNEWGLELRLKDALRFPRNLTLGALENKSLIYELGLEVARQCRAVGVHVNFAPVVDINNNAQNSVINDRSFGESTEQVSERSLLLMQGLQDGGVIACAKHFPGHGDTHLDSHHVLPVIQKSLPELKACELKPFKLLIDRGLQAIMPAHLFFPLICDTKPTTLSEDILEGLLKKEMGFKGLIFTDSLSMKAIKGHLPDGEAEFLALKAGNDVLVCSFHLEKAIERIEQALFNKEWTLEELDQKVLKILNVKLSLIEKNKLLPDQNESLFSPSAKNLKKQLFKEALTLVHRSLGPSFDSKLKTAFVQIGRDLPMKDSLKLSTLSSKEQKPKDAPPFYKTLLQNVESSYYFLSKNASQQDTEALLKTLKGYDQVVVGIYEMNKYSSLNYGLCPSTFCFIESLDPEKLWLTLFGSPYSLKNFSRPCFILMAYENDPDAQEGACEVILGQRKPTAHLPITASKLYPAGWRDLQKEKDGEF